VSLLELGTPLDRLVERRPVLFLARLAT
jgi:hypothetical protein